jgi:hypothetical protein
MHEQHTQTPAGEVESEILNFLDPNNLCDLGNPWDSIDLNSLENPEDKATALLCLLREAPVDEKQWIKSGYIAEENRTCYGTLVSRVFCTAATDPDVANHLAYSMLECYGENANEEERDFADSILPHTLLALDEALQHGKATNPEAAAIIAIPALFKYSEAEMYIADRLYQSRGTDDLFTGIFRWAAQHHAPWSNLSGIYDLVKHFETH